MFSRGFVVGETYRKKREKGIRGKREIQIQIEKDSEIRDLINYPVEEQGKMTIIVERRTGGGRKQRWFLPISTEKLVKGKFRSEQLALQKPASPEA